MHPDILAITRRVKWHGQLAQLNSCLRSLFTAATLAATALTLLVMGFPQASWTCVREAFLGHRHW